MQTVSSSPQMTKSLAAAIGKRIPPETVILLSGPLGAGKTTFAQGLALGLGITEAVTSPTFVLAQCYEGGRLPFAHLDAYRLEGAGLHDLGLEEYWRNGGVTVIEWAENLAAILTLNTLNIEIVPDAGESESRRLFFSCEPGEYPWLEEALKCVY
ncbi:MAG: tRNA (adenosine(37)-N6)-threonylcarbamoyltransferase complex ATPase subunit type 1 TsaE [Clostridiales bacterium]|nr:tRNA (adenosine(37)-N6)-threonylcarbamoyltransferase complex ATPase subunit type 1 TsaE [Clostridiales bacterium]